MNTEQMRARWYSVDATGMATLCRDEADAIKTAADNSIMWPNLAPHKAVQLIEARAALTHPQEPARVGGVPTLSKDQIREVFLSHGFTIKEGQTDLKPYVYDAADALLKLADAALAAQPADGRKAREFFAYHSDMGVEFFNGPDAEAAAKSLCDENLKLERAEAESTDEWADDRAESIRWGVVLGRAKFFENPGQEGEDSGDYKMVGYTTPPASQEQADTVKFSGIDDTLEMGRVRRLLEAQGIHIGSQFIAQLVEAASPSQAQQPSAQAWANETGLRQIECPSCGDLAVAYDPQQPSPATPADIAVYQSIADGYTKAQQPTVEVAKAWDEGYRQGIEDERTSEANIGIAGFGAKVEPNRQNPYLTLATPKPEPMPETVRVWANSPELVEYGNQWQQGYEHARAWVHAQLSITKGEA